MEELNDLKCKNCEFFLDGRCYQSPERLEKKEDDDCDCGFFETLNFKKKLKEAYDIINDIIDYYMDVDENIRNLVNLWIIGTYFHEHFVSFPYLFINAMKGSGKTRLEKIIALLSKEGLILNSPTEAVLFRTKGTLVIDEFESVGNKEKNTLRELLNSCYKKGTKVLRMRKKKVIDGETQEVEEFEPYRPICMANIWGMEEILGDRCINILLEKSTNFSKTKLIEDFANLPEIITLKKSLFSVSKCSLCSVVSPRNIYKEWNEHVKMLYPCAVTHTNYIYTLTNTNSTNSTNNNNLFKKIDETEMDGRNLELFLPLFFIANLIDEKILDKILIYSKKVMNERKIEEVTESKDVMLYGFIAKKEAGKWENIKELTSTFRFLIGEEADWLNAKWMGRALKRLNLIVEKRRLADGIQVTLDTEKAKLKELIFKPITKTEPTLKQSYYEPTEEEQEQKLKAWSEKINQELKDQNNTQQNKKDFAEGLEEEKVSE